MKDLAGVCVDVGEGPMADVSRVVDGKEDMFESAGVDLCCV